MARKGRLERELAEIEAAAAEPSSPERAARVRAALGSRYAAVVARGAILVRDELLGDLEPDLVGAYERFLVDAGKDDPGCQAKIAVLEALDYLGRTDPEPFLAATRYVQREKRWGPPEDTAAGVRARGGLALVRLGFSDALLVLARLLADPEAPVRSAAAQAVAHHGDRQGASLLLLRLGSGEEDPTVSSECLRALCELAPDQAAGVVEPMLRDDALRELAAHAMVAANRDEPLELLLDFMKEVVLARERRVLLEALGLSRRPRARDHLLRLIAEGDRSDAEASVRALAVHSYDPRLAAAVREAAEANAAFDLADLVAESFPT